MIANTTLPPAQAVLAVLGFVAVGVLLWLFVKLFSRKMSGWAAILKRFPMRGSKLIGEEYRKQSGTFGNMGDSWHLTLRITQEGVIVCPSFARRKPCLVPWSDIRSVAVGDSTLLVTVDYERPFQFFLPATLLPTLQAKLHSELFHKAVSPFEAAKAALKDGTQPRWVRVIGGSAVKLAEKELEKEKKRRG
jgi:hypothetical protein